MPSKTTDTSACVKNTPTGIFDKAADENLSAFHETTPNNGFYGPRRFRMMKERRGGKKHYATFCFYIGNFERQKTIRTELSWKYDLRTVFKNPGRYESDTVSCFREGKRGTISV